MLVFERRPGSSVLIGRDIRIQVQSIKGSGRVKLAIDAPRAVSVVRGELCPNGAPEESPYQPKSGLRVLAIEDDVDHARAICDSLEDCGVTDCEVITNGQNAKARIATLAEPTSHRPDLILLDRRLPQISGLEILRYIRASEKLRTIPVIMLSCDDSDPSVAESLEAGANAFVTKTIERDDLRASIARVVDFWRNARRVSA